ncbi:uncharacterized protein PRCAT00003901001 [Priceomyces carsonii]|uniref:uncharacterized protein n=1 Tax=Priceomyces carsonii TaxID=28549 RepID=UPI002ED93F19|nr:unnamed protein product [Priceomyces carsonii]
MSTNSNILKRKNEDLESTSDDQLNKRVALDSEQLAISEKQEEEAQTAPIIGSANGSIDLTDGAHEEESSEEQENVQSETQSHGTEEPKIQSQDLQNEVKETQEVIPDLQETYQPKNDSDLQEQVPEAGKDDTYFNDGQYDQDYNDGDDDQFSKATSNHREKESDPTYVQFRMYCPVKEASCIVGKKGEKINHIRDKANVRINVSENLKNVPERIVLVRGAAENVARAFGLIARTILEEPEDEPASMLSKQYNLKVLVPHPMVGFIIGKQGSKFREIEENSAAKLKAAEQPLPYSTDRILSITGVGDAIHIAVYYISQVMIEHKDCLKKNKIVYYNPANYHHTNLSTNMMNMSMMPSNSNMMLMGGNSTNPLLMQGVKDNTSSSPYAQQQKQPYNFQMMFQPSAHPQQQYASPVSATTSLNVPPQTQYTDEHGNTMIGDVITSPPVQVGPNPDKFNEDIFVANSSIGSVIGKGGNNIKHIRENSGCTYVKIEPDKNQSIMVGGRGLTNIRKLTLTGSLSSIQTAIFLINQRIGADKERNNIH